MNIVELKEKIAGLPDNIEIVFMVNDEVFDGEHAWCLAESMTIEGIKIIYFYETEIYEDRQELISAIESDYCGDEQGEEREKTLNKIADECNHYERLVINIEN